MSHFTILVIGKNAEEQLAPFSENLPLNFEDTEAKLREEYRTETGEAVRFKNGELVCKYSDQLSSCWARDGIGFRSSNVFTPPLDSELVTVPVSEIYKTFEIYAKEYHGTEKDEKTGKYGHWHNENSKWDWYSLGGRWSGLFKTKKGKSGRVGRPGAFDNVPKPGHVDSALLKDIDFEEMRNDAVLEAFERYEKVERLLGGSIPVIDCMWKDMIDSDSRFKDMNIAQKREVYHNQEAMVTLTRATQNASNKDDQHMLAWLNLEDFQMPKAKFVQNARDKAITTFAVLKDGKWFQRGEIGWWGSVSNEVDETVWIAEFNKLLSDLPGDTVLSVYDCHI